MWVNSDNNVVDPLMSGLGCRHIGVQMQLAAGGSCGSCGPACHCGRAAAAGSVHFVPPRCPRRRRSCRHRCRLGGGLGGRDVADAGGDITAVVRAIFVAGAPPDGVSPTPNLHAHCVPECSVAIQCLQQAGPEAGGREQQGTPVGHAMGQQPQPSSPTLNTRANVSPQIERRCITWAACTGRAEGVGAGQRGRRRSTRMEAWRRGRADVFMDPQPGCLLGSPCRPPSLSASRSPRVLGGIR